MLEFQQKYIEDAGELIANLESELINFENDSESEEIIQEAYRVMHTMKGTSGMYGFNHICYLKHELESVFNLRHFGVLVVTTKLFNITLATVEHLRNLLNGEQLSNQQNAKFHKTLKKQAQQILENSWYITTSKKNKKIIPIQKYVHGIYYLCQPKA